MNWGHKIVLVFAGFVGLIISFVVICMRQKDIHLVTEKYYEKEIAYQHQIDIEKNTAKLAEKPVVAYTKQAQTVLFTYPKSFTEEKVAGTILFFRPADATKDFEVPLQAGEDHQQVVSVAALEKGLWKIKMEWASQAEQYYLEERLVVL